MNSFANILTLSALSVAVAASALADDKNVRYLSLYNNGGYNIDPVILKWKDSDGKVHDKNMGAKIGKGEAICIDLNDKDYVAIGDQVWFVAHIEAGDTESCKKSNKRFKADNDAVWYTFMGGTTFNNNRCQNSDIKSYTASTRVKGNSTYCAPVQ